MNDVKRRVTELKEGMVISRDIISEEGIFLIPKETIVSKNHILKMQLYQITNAFVYEGPDDVDAPPKEVFVSQTTQFKSFVSKYETQVTMLENEINNMIESGQINHLALNDIVADLVSADHAGELFTYLCRVQTGDEYTFAHSLNVSILAHLFGKWLHLSESDVLNLSIAGLLHDIGKTQLDLAILNKKEPLTEEEFEHIKTHTSLGYDLVEFAPIDIGIKQAVLLHHERMNSSGYPLNVDWDHIHVYAKVIAIVDIYAAMTSDRPYRKRFHPFKAIQTLEEEYLGLLDTDYLFVFLANIAHNFIGNDVLLSNGAAGKIVFINTLSPSHPLIQVGGTFVDLYTNDKIHIEAFL